MSSKLTRQGALLLLFVSLVAEAQFPAQSSNGSRVPTGRQGVSSAPDPHYPDNSVEESVTPEDHLRRESARNLERKRRMADDAKRLVQLTEQFRKDVAEREMTAEDARRLDEIAKLARAVKDRMRN